MIKVSLYKEQNILSEDEILDPSKYSTFEIVESTEEFNPETDFKESIEINFKK